MKKFLGIILMFLLIVGPSALLYSGEGTTGTTGTAVTAGTTTYRTDIGEKVARGTKNILYGWTELPKRVVDITKETNNPVWGALAGTFQGTLKAMARTVSGASDVLTAPISPEKEPFVQTEINVE